MKSFVITTSFLVFGAQRIFAIPFTSDEPNAILQGRAVPKLAHVAAEKNAPWHLVRISEKKGDTNALMTTDNGTYYHDSRSGAGVDAYVIDTEITTTHPDFGGRFQMFGYGQSVSKNMSGHGTAVAGVLGGSKFGVAKKVNLLGCYSDLYTDCITMITKRHKERAAGKEADPKNNDSFVGSVINISRATDSVVLSQFGISPHQQRIKFDKLQAAITAAIKEGIHITLAAGNDHQDACETAPQGIYEEVQDMLVVEFSNTGGCVNIWAPGEQIGQPTVNDGYTKNDGTSFAAPIVAGVIAEMMVRHPKLSQSPRKMKNFLLGKGDHEGNEIKSKNGGPTAGRTGVIEGYPDYNVIYNGIHEV
ncbi:hypothetical protein H072_7665 [Dactylellina haptotyla CBS 200.50]|uniref:Peptidase S8/S53 domain-containing protein n=1 Tax=Dactylellina haptotyla (strain CBS 200.50) TaxID=1284197 RepID=S8A6T4_DACHA|nr:hypothetical protein H072_7665 [Dactylellina haptotyla CBS 200.50]